MKSRHLNLAHGKLLRLEASQGWSLHCLQGALMLSGPWPVGDQELHPGQIYTLPNQRLFLAEAWGATRLELRPPKPAERPTTRWLNFFSQFSSP